MRYLISFVLAFVLWGCKKDKGSRQTGTAYSKSPLRSIEWSDGIKASFSYNIDNNLIAATHSFQNRSAAVTYKWENKKLSEISNDNSLYKDNYFYRGERITHMINSYKQVSLPGIYKMEYGYNAGGLVSFLKYSVINEAGTEVKASSVYSYNAAGEIIEIKTQIGNLRAIRTISGYSETVDFDPLVFTPTTLDEDYEIYNLPVMRQLKKLPAKTTYQFSINNAPFVEDKISTHQYIVVNRRLEKMTTSIRFPNYPAGNKTTEALFKY